MQKPDTSADAGRAARTARILDGPILSTLLLLSAPNLVVMAAQATANFLESYYVGRLGVDSLAAAALVFPLVMLMQMMSVGGIGGAVSSAIAQALGGGDRDQAEALARHAVILALAIGLICTALAICAAPWLFAAMGGRGGALTAAIRYSDVIFAGSAFLWLLNIQASILRGAGDMTTPAVVLVAGVVVLLLGSPALIFGWGPLPALGIRGAGLALVLYYLLGSLALGLQLTGGKRSLRLKLRGPLRKDVFGRILGVGAFGILNNLGTNLSVIAATAFIAPLGVDTLAGFGLGVRLEYLQIPIVFGLGTTMVAMVGMNIGAGRLVRARQIAWTGALVAGFLTEVTGLAASVFAEPWPGLFTLNRRAIDVGTRYLHAVAPAYGLLGFAFAFYFASQGRGRMGWAALAVLFRVGAIILFGAVAARIYPGSLDALFPPLILALLGYAALNVAPWLRPPRAPVA